MKVIYNTEPEAILYMPLPNGKSDVWLRKNIQITIGEDGDLIWTADEVYFQTTIDKDSVEINFETLYANKGNMPSSETGETDEEEISIDEALAIIMGVLE